jgi:oligopeptide/dipeptide ABC transporter ATP-binding protein
VAEPLLVVRDLRVAFPSRAGRGRETVAVDGVDLEVVPGEPLGIVGDSGAGKSTLAQACAGLLRPTAGHVLIDGIDLATARGDRLRQARRHVSIVFQDAAGSFNPMRTVEHALSLPLRHFTNLDAPAIRTAVGDMMERVGLHASQMTRYPHEFSGGQVQRLAIARALIARPRIVILDEPVSALDVSIRAQILNLLRDLAADYGLTYVLIATDPSVVAHMTARTVVLYGGRVLEAGPRPTVFAAPRHPYTVSLLSLNDVDGRIEAGGLLANRATDVDPTGADGCPFAGTCPLELEPCRTVRPSLVAVGDAHLARCHAFAPRNGGPT